MSACRPVQPTIVDVAEQAGVSKSAAARVLAGTGPYSESTRIRVELAARQLGYVANAMARGLVRGRTRTIGMVVRDTVSPLYAQIRAVVEEQALESGYRVLTTTGVGRVANEKAALAALISLRVDGLVVCSGLLPADDIAEFALRVPTVVVGRPELHPHLASVYCDEADGGLRMADHLADLGHRVVGVLIVPRSSALTQNDRSMAMAARLRQRGVTVVEVVAPLERGAGEIVRELLERGRPDDTARQAADSQRELTAVMCPTDLRAVEVAGALEAHGVAVPGEVSVSGFDGMPPLDSAWIGLTTFQQPVAQMALRAMELLLGKIDDPEVPVEHICLRGVVLAGNSVVMAPPAIDSAPDS
ncbi:DNA-binding transcriptional regulator, LacI/PurR family [Propionibacterium cyclohexanicum]|uniref:DNA-binding transcriptional regulator, LacI/PurR family n=1 Tax=Propionibacterium cyclohexanicum TaxID=64702 RepID=A0A1H9QFW6_9ACTN|nr:LacI family DNA-binding transcriptional regulator [Propionibacterium cyclohexanicum]SER58673.1 DNA-binding transcriptional regulator, LacI/PurR family [Propionibacterium cyclohexanicum]